MSFSPSKYYFFTQGFCLISFTAESFDLFDEDSDDDGGDDEDDQSIVGKAVFKEILKQASWF